MEVVVGVPFGYEPSAEVREILEDFRDMINFCIDYAVENGITSYARLRKGIYEEWKRRWDYSSHFCHSACKIALAMLKSYRKKKQGKPVARKLFMQLDPQLYKFHGDRIRISVRPRQFLFIALKFGEYQKRFIDAWREGKLRTGEITINESKIVVPFKKEVDLQNPDDWIAIDINEANVTAASSNSLLRLEHELRTVHTTYFCIRRRIQKLAKLKPKTAERLMKKYSGRENRKARDVCHKISRAIVDFAKEHDLGIIVENLKGIRNRIRYSRNLNRRLHSWNFRRLQFYIDKAKLEGLPVVYVNPEGTSSLCPMCGGKLRKAPNGHRRVACRCGYENDRDVTACLNMLRMRGVPFPLKALERGKTSATHATKATNVAESQNGCMS